MVARLLNGCLTIVEQLLHIC